ENTFADLMRTFSKHNNREPVRVSGKEEFNLTFRLCLLLMNIRNFAKAASIEVLPCHSAWMEPGFDYQKEKTLTPASTETYTVQQKLESGAELLKLQQEFLGV